MRISDWSSDVCSSDLLCAIFGKLIPGVGADKEPELQFLVLSTKLEKWIERLVPARPISIARSFSATSPKFGRAACRERVCHDVLISVGAVSFKTTVIVDTAT